MKQVIQAIEKQIKIQKSLKGADRIPYLKELNNAWMVLNEAQNALEGIVSKPTFKYKHVDGTYSDIEVNLIKIID